MSSFYWISNCSKKIRWVAYYSELIFSENNWFVTGECFFRTRAYELPVALTQNHSTTCWQHVTVWAILIRPNQSGLRVNNLLFLLLRIPVFLSVTTTVVDYPVLAGTILILLMWVYPASHQSLLFLLSNQSNLFPLLIHVQTLFKVWSSDLPMYKTQ